MNPELQSRKSTFRLIVRSPLALLISCLIGPNALHAQTAESIQAGLGTLNYTLQTFSVPCPNPRLGPGRISDYTNFSYTQGAATIPQSGSTSTLYNPSCGEISPGKARLTAPGITVSFVSGIAGGTDVTATVGYAVAPSFKSETASYTSRTGFLGSSLASTTSWTWTDTESQGAINGTANQIGYTLSSNTPSCAQDILVFEDTVFHTFVTQQAPGNTTCP